jgi:predicted lipoprotein with Yx(FWY)xxD motif
VLCSAAVAQPKGVGGQLVSCPGFSLHTFDNDVADSGRSVCNTPCSGIFPPYLVEVGAQTPGSCSTITRSDGSRQWAYKGKPLYAIFDDKKLGRTGGDGMNDGMWHVAGP